MINNKTISLGCQVWGNLLGTDPNLLRAWCKHYDSIDYIDKVFLKINYNDERVSDLKIFEDIILSTFKHKTPIITTSNIAYAPNGGSDSMYRFHTNNLEQNTDIYIPRDVDELIDFNILTLNIVEEFINDDNIPAIMGYTRDRIQVNGDNQLILSDINPSLQLNEQFPLTQQDISFRLRRSLRKVVMIKNTHALTGGGVHSYYDRVTNLKHSPEPHPRSIPIDHYCWTKSSVYNRKYRPNARHKGYRVININIDKYFIINTEDLYDRQIPASI